MDQFTSDSRVSERMMPTTRVADTWRVDWFARALVALLDDADAERLAVWAHAYELRALCDVLLCDHSARAPLRRSGVLQCAARHGWWRAVVTIQRQNCAPTSRHWRMRTSRQQQLQLREAFVVEGVAPHPELEQMLRSLRYIPSWLCAGVAMTEAARCGRVDDVVWLHSCVKYARFDAIRAAATSGHLHIVQWFVDLEPDWTECVLSLADSGDLGLIMWRSGSHGEIRACMAGEGMLPLRGLRDSYPFMDWAAECGRVDLLKRFDAHPRTRSRCSSDSIVNAAALGYTETVQWLVAQPDFKMAHLARIVAGAAGGGHMGLLQWLFSSFRVEDATSSAIRAGVQGGHIEVVRWLFENCVKVGHRPHSPIHAAAICGSLKMFVYLHEVQGYEVESRTLEFAAAAGHFEAASYLHKFSSFGQNHAEEMLSHAAGSGSLATVRWLVDELGLWSTKAAEAAAIHGRVDVLDFLYTRAVERSEIARIPLEDCIQTRKINALYLLTIGEVDTARWILKNVREKPPFARGFDVQVYTAMPRPRRLEHNQQPRVEECEDPATPTLELEFIRYRPAFARLVKRFPLWAVYDATMKQLRGLDAIDHPQLWTRATLAAMLTRSRNAEMMEWFITRQPQLVTPQVARWAAQYGAINVLRRIITDTQARSQVATRRLVRAAMWSAAVHDRELVLQCLHDDRWINTSALGDQEYAWRELPRAAARHGGTSVLGWLLRQNRLSLDTAVAATHMADTAAQYGQLQCLRWLQEQLGAHCSQRGRHQAVGRGFDEVVVYIDACNARARERCACGAPKY